MGVLNRTTDSFYDGGAYFDLDALLSRADTLVADGADVLDVGARSGGVGTRGISVEEETHLVCEDGAVPAVPYARSHLDTWRAEVVTAVFAAAWWWAGRRSFSRQGSPANPNQSVFDHGFLGFCCAQSDAAR